MLDGKCESVTPVNRQTYGAKFQRANIITCYAKTILDSRTLTGKYCVPVVSEELRIDIDNEHDFYLAELVLTSAIMKEAIEDKCAEF